MFYTVICIYCDMFGAQFMSAMAFDTDDFGATGHYLLQDYVILLATLMSTNYSLH